MPGFFKLIVNAADNQVDDPNMDTLKAADNLEENTISAYNNGCAIPVEIHEREEMHIFTQPTPLAHVLYNPADDALLNARKTTTASSSPFYMPVIPLVLVSGAEGIGAGRSFSVLQPDRHRRWPSQADEGRGSGAHGALVAQLQGSLQQLSDLDTGIARFPGKAKHIDCKEHHDNLNVHFIVSTGAKGPEKAEAQGPLEFKLNKLNTSNLLCFDFEGKFKKYNSVEDIPEDFYPARLACHQKRKVTPDLNIS
ncbi:hypothetical protein HYPSUDRAFT_198196 [Hypholoma sublateritium FD-334 SS-4]|uniref:DNA topoisomerase (ATP-hydrolyzing) n=1 Tax=Hypholoma sublateritium (strain FD-334 SS-4) TaxID=945553 RepID=A0A0D2Q6R2_HYPSF|nr:hypothetical protein HYPSUDRAFT_198196 [Hypholoma sublateritium FD-334 SS-4]